MRILLFKKKVHYQTDKNAATLCNDDESMSIQKTHVLLEEVQQFWNELRWRDNWVVFNHFSMNIIAALLIYK